MLLKKANEMWDRGRQRVKGEVVSEVKNVTTLYSLFCKYFPHPRAFSLMSTDYHYTLIYHAKVMVLLLALVRSLRTQAHISWKIFTKMDYYSKRCFHQLLIVKIYKHICTTTIW